MDNELMNSDFFKSLPGDVKEKLKNCKSEEEAMDILKENMIEIPADELKNVSGGYRYQITTHCPGDSREETAIDGSMSRDYEEGRITGADYFN